MSSALRTTNHVGGPLLNAIATDHQEIYNFYDEYVKNAGNADAQDRWAHQLQWEIARHSIGEELVVYPLFEKHLGEEGKRMAEEDRREHQTVKDLLYKLEKLKVGTPEHASTTKAIIDHLKPHADSEEQHDLPALQKAIGNDAAAQAAKSFERTKKFVPTRSHPSAPARPPFETLAGLMAAPMDKLKDAFSKFPDDEEVEAVKTKNQN
ncbi:hypothetical protein CPC08DRAFT_709063 [Agrocybe pediades]|nr:hypothetical protein CPC08DRAFT_709063 [Agrocybe pediades]